MIKVKQIALRRLSRRNRAVGMRRGRAKSACRPDGNSTAAAESSTARSGSADGIVLRCEANDVFAVVDGVSHRAVKHLVAQKQGHLLVEGDGGDDIFETQAVGKRHLAEPHERVLHHFARATRDCVFPKMSSCVNRPLA